MEKIKIRYIGQSFGVDSLTDGKVYECLGVEMIEDDDFFPNFSSFPLLRVIDDSEENHGYLYSPINPAPMDGSSPGGKWEIVEDDENGTLAKLIK